MSIGNNPGVNEDGENKEQGDAQPLPFTNPLKEGDYKQFTEEDLENEQKYKEALTERD